MPPIVIFFICAVLLLGAVIALWRYWDRVARITPEEQAFDRRVAALNERQANRMSDDLLRRDVSQDDAWRIMVARGKKAERRRNRYDGDLGRRTRERRRP